jgi:nucleotide-binding universal stress UspA family protein
MYKKILVPVDGSATSLRGLDEAIKLAAGSAAQLKLVHIVNEFIMETGYGPAQYHERLIETLRESGQKVLADAQAAVQRHGMQAQAELVETIGGRAADAIVQQARSWPADLIVMGTHGRRGLKRLAMGSDAELVLRSSPVPVLLVREAPEKT